MVSVFSLYVPIISYLFHKLVKLSKSCVLSRIARQGLVIVNLHTVEIYFGSWFPLFKNKSSKADQN